MTSFTSWDSELYHHGIKGQRRGVRRYQYEDGSLTPLGKIRYGENSSKSVSARKITRDYNNLDRGYANAAARQKRANAIGRKLSVKAAKRGMTAEQVITGTDRLSKKIRKAAAARRKAGLDMANIEKMQYRVLGKAASQGYTITSKPVKRMGVTGKQKAAELLGGPIGSMLYSSITKGSSMQTVNGSKIKASKKGDGSITVINSKAGEDYYKKHLKNK